MKKRYIVAVILLVVILAVIGLQQVRTYMDRNALPILIQSARQSESLSYTGTVETSVLYYGKKINNLTRVYHKGCLDRVEYVSEPMKGMVVVANDRETYTYHPHTDNVISSTAPAKALERKKLELLLKNYNAVKVGTGHIAGRPVVVVDVTPKLHGNPSKRLWIDSETFLVLKQKDLSATGKVKSEMTYREVKYSADIPGNKFVFPSGTAGSVRVGEPMTREKLSKLLGFTVTRPAYVPRGYELSNYQLFRCRCNCGHNAAHISYTDGLNSISVFETPVSEKDGEAGCSRHSRNTPHGCQIGDCRQARVGQVRAGDKCVTVVADLPVEEIERIAKSVK